MAPFRLNTMFWCICVLCKKSREIDLKKILFLQDCVQVPTDGKRSSNLTSRNYGIYDGSLTELNPPISSEIKDGQWLGVEVKSQGEGGKVIVCAHRYVAHVT